MKIPACRQAGVPSVVKDLLACPPDYLMLHPNLHILLCLDCADYFYYFVIQFF